MTGAEFAALSDDELNAQVDGIGVVARVAPEDKVRLVSILKGQGNIVAMTGDGVNDAPALTRADIGVAMGITGTEVTKDAAEMILTDDNFATIVTAVEGGRGLYDNLMKYIRVQMIMLAGFILTFVGAGVFDIANGVPLTPLQILYINFAIDVLLAIGLGFDAPTPGLMKRGPRSPDDPVIPRPLAARLGFAGLLIAIGVLAVVAYGEDRYGLLVATTMGLVTTALLHIAASVEWRDPRNSAFRMATIANARFNKLVLASLALTVLVTTLNILERIFDTAELTGPQWRVCLIAVIGYIVLAEIGKFIVRRVDPEGG
jgi:Ca2+-transporting ATPase